MVDITITPGQIPVTSRGEPGPRGTSWSSTINAATSATTNITRSGEQTIDGVLTAASVVLLTGQTAPAENGVYTTAAGAWTRHTGADTWAELPGLYVFVTGGTLRKHTGWACTVVAGGALGTTAITFQQHSAPLLYTASSGLTLTGQAFSIATAGIVTVMIADDQVTYAKIQPVSATDRLLGRFTAGAGDIEEIVCTPFARTVLDDANAAAAAVTLAVLPTAGGTLTGFLTLHADPVNPLHAVTKQYADALIATTDAMVFKGVIDCSSNPNYPAADRGHTYRVSVAGKIGGGSGPNVEAGDLLVCLTDGTASGNHGTVGANWTIAQSNLDGAVIGPASAVDSRIAEFNGTSGKLLKDGGVVISAFLKTVLDDSTAAAARATLEVMDSRAFNVLTPHEALVNKFLSTSTLSIAASAVTLFDANGNAKRFASLSETLNIANSGANGLDTGSEAASTWYHLWAIGKSDGTLDGLLSASATSPTMPAGYDYKGYLGAVYNNGSSNFLTFLQRGRDVLQEQQSMLGSGTSATYATVSLAASVPTTATIVHLACTIDTSSGTAVVTAVIAPAGSGTTATYGANALVDQTDGSGRQQELYVMMETAQQVVYFVTGTNGRLSLAVRGYRF